MTAIWKLELHVPFPREPPNMNMNKYMKTALYSFKVDLYQPLG